MHTECLALDKGIIKHNMCSVLTLVILYLGHRRQCVIDKASTRRRVLFNTECLLLII